MLLVVNTMRSRPVIEAAVEDLLDRQVDAIIFASAGTRRVTLPAAVARVPTVLVSCFTAGNTIPCVLPDEVAGGRAATRLLLDAGHTRVAYLTGAPGAWATRGGSGATARPWPPRVSTPASRSSSRATTTPTPATS